MPVAEATSRPTTQPISGLSPKAVLVRREILEAKSTVNRARETTATESRIFPGPPIMAAVTGGGAEVGVAAEVVDVVIATTQISNRKTRADPLITK